MDNANRIEVRGVLAGAYASQKLDSLLTHAVEVDEAGNDVRVLCSRVKLENICDLNEGERPTCPVCAKRAP